MSAETVNINGSLGINPTLCFEAKLNKNLISVSKYGSNQISFVADIYKSETSQLLVATDAVSFLRPATKLSLNHYGLKENGVSGFIRSQVTGEAFIMTEVKGTGNIRLRPCAGPLSIEHYQDIKFCVPNTNVSYLIGILGSFEISSPPKIKSSIPLNFAEINLKDALLLLEAEEVYEVAITTEIPLEVEANDIAFWQGDIMLEDVKESDQGNLVKFTGNGKIYLSLSV